MGLLRRPELGREGHAEHGISDRPRRRRERRHPVMVRHTAYQAVVSAFRYQAAVVSAFRRTGSWATAVVVVLAVAAPLAQGTEVSFKAADGIDLKGTFHPVAR